MLETHFDKFTLVHESNNAGVLGRSTQPPEANRVSGAEPRALRRFYSLFSIKYAILEAYFGLNFC